MARRPYRSDDLFLDDAIRTRGVRGNHYRRGYLFPNRPTRALALITRAMQPHADRVDTDTVTFVGPCVDLRAEPGVARRIDTEDATPENLRAALVDLVDDPEVRTRSAQLCAAALAEGGTSRAADLIEDMLS